jgi:dienelactone hydrolase
MAIIGTADRWTPPDDVAALEAAGVTVVRYDGADHGFVHDPDRPVHRADDAADAWRKAVAFLSG